MAIDHAVLATEVQLPAYDALRAAGNDQGIADALNAVQAGITIRRADVSSEELWEAIQVSDMTALPGNPTAAQLSVERRQLAWLSGLPSIPRLRLLNDNGTNAPAAENLLAIFPNGSGTRTRIVALASRQGSRAEELFGAGTRIGSLDVARALERG